MTKHVKYPLRCSWQIPLFLIQMQFYIDKAFWTGHQWDRSGLHWFMHDFSFIKFLSANLGKVIFTLLYLLVHDEAKQSVHQTPPECNLLKVHLSPQKTLFLAENDRTT